MTLSSIDISLFAKLLLVLRIPIWFGRMVTLIPVPRIVVVCGSSIVYVVIDKSIPAVFSDFLTIEA